MHPDLYIGIMSGTSLDGVDTVLCRIQSDGKPSCLARHHRPFEPALRQRLLALNAPGPDELHVAHMLANQLANAYASGVNEMLAHEGIHANQVRAIGAHGQTVRHRPDLRYTVQINSPALLAEQTGIDVIADFRSRDIAAGGQGAPLVPAFHARVFSGCDDRVILNLGGIANVTILKENGHVLGFDTGPANLLMDAWCEQHTGQPFDEAGRWGATGQVNLPLLDRLFKSQPWFDEPAPKSTGRDMFNMHWLQSILAQCDAPLSPADVQATLQHLTALSVLTALEREGLTSPDLFVCGGGARNEALMQLLVELGARSAQTTDTLGIPSQDVEAIAFAWLAWAFTQRQPANLPQVTGARSSRILGALWPA